MPIDADLRSRDMASRRVLACVTTFGLVTSGGNLVQWRPVETVAFPAIEDAVHLESPPAAGDAERNALRTATWTSARDLARDPCSPLARQSYIAAVTAYIRARNALVPCLATKTCGLADQTMLASFGGVFRTELDQRVSEAMADAHAHTAFQAGDFPPDVIGNLASLTLDPNLIAGLPPQIRRAPAAQCS